MESKDSPKVDPILEAYAALGHYIALCSLVEGSLHMCLKHFLGISEPIERLLVGEPRIGDLIDLVKRSARLSGCSPETYEFLEFLAGITAENNKIRQIVAHKPSSIFEGRLNFHNHLTAKTEESAYWYVVTPEELHNQARVLQALSSAWLLCTALAPDRAPESSRVHRDRIASLRSNPLPKIPNPPPPPKLPKQPRQPRPSPG